jgi:hypothetical protein
MQFTNSQPNKTKLKSLKMAKATRIWRSQAPTGGPRRLGQAEQSQGWPLALTRHEDAPERAHNMARARTRARGATLRWLARGRRPGARTGECGVCRRGSPRRGCSPTARTDGARWRAVARQREAAADGGARRGAAVREEGGG